MAGRLLEGGQVRAARVRATLDEVELGDHVCWRMDPAASLLTDVRAFVADGALYGDKIVVVGGHGDTFHVSREGVPSSSVVLDRSETAGADSVLAAVRREARTAEREGFRSVRVLAERRPITAHDGVEELLDQELRLDQFASESGAIVVCALRPAQWDGTTLEHVTGVHPHEVGTRAVHPAFRMFSTGADTWSVDGVIDAEGAPAFSAALRAAVLRAPMLRLCFDALELIDAAGMRALVDTVRRIPDHRVLVEGANDTVRLCWELAGYAGADLRVVMSA
ncbi:MEDS domain-containing protein [Streptomyces sp. NPDC006711]|uniref:MEDS domain-containing protein n=1 Tax=Streptomyces sp. NPDC006711 TaxID=3364762 RepID=UPI0036AB2D79